MRNIFEKSKAVTELIRANLGSLEGEEILEMARACAKFHYKKSLVLSKDQARLYELFISKGFNPDTVYKWLLLTRTHPELRDRLKTRAVSQRNAFKEKNAIDTIVSYSEQDLLRDIIKCVERYVIR